MSNNKNIPDWEKAYWKQKQQGVNPLAGGDTYQPPQPTRGGNGEIDITSMLQQRAMSGQFQQNMNPHATAVESKVCHIREGVTFYRAVSNSFGTTVPLVVSVGVVSGVIGKQFENKGFVKCFVVDSNSGAIDLAKMNENSDKYITLVKVSAPFVGEILVAESAIMKLMGTTSGQTILRD